MKALILLILICGISIFSYSQTTDNPDKQLITNALNTAAASPVIRKTNAVRGTTVPRIPIASAFSPQLIQSLQSAVNSLPQQTRINLQLARQQSMPCEDTSYMRLLSITNGALYMQSLTKTADGGMLATASMTDTSKPFPGRYWRLYGLLFKLDESGTITWIKQMEELSPTFSSIGLTNTFELANHDIIYTGQVDSSGNAPEKTFVFRLTSTGNVIWQNYFISKLGIFGSPQGTFRFMINDATDGLNGDVILSGTNNSNISYGKMETAARLNNQGQLIWDVNFPNFGTDGSYMLGAEGIASFVENGQINFVGLSHGTSYYRTVAAINFLTLDYNTGNLIKKRFFRPDYANANTMFYKSFSYWYNKCIRLNNGHYMFYGRLMSGGSGLTPIIEHFGAVEFDQSFNLANAYTIASPMRTNYYNDNIHFDPSGKGIAAMFESSAVYQVKFLFATVNNQQFSHQRLSYYNNVGTPDGSGFVFLNDGGYVYMQTHFDIQPTIQPSYLEFKKMHDSDTSSVCLGRDTNLAQIIPLNVIEDPAYPYLDPNKPNYLVSIPLNYTLVDTLTHAHLNPCKQTNYCDTLKIHGSPTVCGGVNYLDFTSYKRDVCGGFVQWSLNPAVTDSMKITSDSSMRVWFKNKNWQGNLYAGLTSSTCFTPAADSMQITIIQAQSQIDLGTDNKVLCPPNTMVLHAGNYFSTYHWQDGSSDSTLTVSSPGKYWVEAHDNCANAPSDTIIILPFTETISIGPDRAKCNNDTLRLNAPAGFLNYQWSNNYYLNTVTPQNVIVNPLIDTAYYIKAEKIPGCFAYDTVRVTVRTSIPIQLGADTSFCNGQNLLLDAGNGFNSYVWNTGSTGQQLNVKTSGSYSVIGTMTNGCRSYDTLRVLSVWAQPVFSLNHNPSLCVGETRTLKPGNFAAYLWQDGSTGNSFTVTSPGKYYVTVGDNHACSASDTTLITTMRPVPASFLPADSAVCSYGKLEIIPRGTYATYLWSNSATTSTITVKKAGLYWLNVTDNNNCSGRDSINILAKECLTGFYVPNAFTPNHDGKNDLFKPIIGGIVEQYQFNIYSRWGQLLFSSNDRFQGWDGTVGGKPQGNNTFVWSCRFKLEGDEEERLERGTVILIR